MNRPSDEQLTAYLDDELDPAYRSQLDGAIADDPLLSLRVQWLDRSSLPYKKAYDELAQQAPLDRLQARLDAIAPAQRPGLSRRWFIGAAAAGLLAGGVLADRLFIAWQAQQSHNWRALVGDYMALYVPQTLDHLPSDEASQRAQLRAVDARLGLNLSPARVTLPGAELKRAQMLEYDGVPIAQLTYLDTRHGPLALCVIRSNSGSRPLAHERRHEMNVVYWTEGEHAWMLIGHNPAPALEDLARHLIDKLGA
ncbi:Transmembrane transcriptional regulator (anti-sigma factor RsiW) [Pseudomonas koreensis]|uniref:transcriptional regulator n=1 Tax=Pseudomonas koreensis TaxID=198620 RepID=UPI0008798C0F|nr:transcriptional regulator [Pseudomonas koreensis]KAB0513818.1 transcriptional regulator [Pseudomonas koreensis]NNA63406.1 transcriptional regulator [Pseudomonas koreensis]GGK34804.1 membrane protein [Pseudomonas koreensis]SDE47711.1 Transmembrane transcriptional regulator (anti-sigma factor RsiW) [Pseudomonas koreensis]